MSVSLCISIGEQETTKKAPYLLVMNECTFVSNSANTRLISAFTARVDPTPGMSNSADGIAIHLPS